MMVNPGKEGVKESTKDLLLILVRYLERKKSSFFIHVEEEENEKIFVGPSCSQLGTGVG
jgi:hypothetical protein